MAGTLLGGGVPVSDAEVEAGRRLRELEKKAEEIAQFILQCLVDGYTDGELTFENAIRYVHSACAVEHMPGYLRQKFCGAAVEAIVKARRPGGKRSRRAHPQWVCRVCHDLVSWANKVEGLSIVRGSRTNQGKTAFDRALEILRMRGITIIRTPLGVEHARAAWRPPTDSG